MKKSLVLGLVSAVLFCLSVYPLPWFPLGVFAFLPLFLICTDPAKNIIQTTLAAALAGFIFFAYSLRWVHRYDLSAYYGSVYASFIIFPVFFFSLKWICGKTQSPWKTIPVAWILWTVLHRLYLRTPIGGIPAEAPFYGPLWMLQWAAFGGFLVPFGIILSINALAAFWIQSKNIRYGFAAAAFIVLLPAAHCYFVFFMPPKTEAHGKAALIQHNLPYPEIWRKHHLEEMNQAYEGWAREAAAGHPNLIIFPLYDLPGDPSRNPDFFSNLAKSVGVSILVASHIPKEAGDESMAAGYLNLALLFSKEGQPAGVYQNVEAPPWAPGNIKVWTKDHYEILDTPLGRAGVMLCYEDTNFKWAREAKKQGAQILIALSNPGQFTETHQPYYHLLQDQLRALETGLPLIRVSANGYTAHINARGEVLQRANLNQSKILQVSIRIG